MNAIRAISLTSAVNDWMANSHHSRILHIFDRACDLINENGEILSIVTPDIGNGPFNLVVKTDILFTGPLSIESAVSVSADDITLGSLNIPTAEAKLWNAQPDWELLHASKEDIVKQVAQLPVTTYLNQGGLDMPSSVASGYSTATSLQSLVSNLSSALAVADISAAKDIASKLAGLGQGLTPSGDDFIMGALHAAWIIHPQEVASGLAQSVAETAAPLTTSLSAAWIRSAGRGEAGELWHQFFDALVSGDEIEIQKTMKNILAVGETSGADALAGFVGVFQSWKIVDSSVS